MDELENNEIQANEVADNEITANPVVDSETENTVSNDELLDNNSDQVSGQVDPEPIPEPEEFHDYQLTPEDIANGVKLLPNFDDIVDDGTVEKPYAIFKDGVIVTLKLPWQQFNVSSDVFHNGDEVRKDQSYLCHYSGRRMTRSEWVSGYTAKEYNALRNALDTEARKEDHCIDEWRGEVKAQKLEDVANDHYNLKTKEEQDEWDKAQEVIQRYARIAELKAKMLETDYVWNVIRECDATEEHYADVLANRKAWRAEIRELEKDSKDDSDISEKEKMGD